MKFNEIEKYTKEMSIQEIVKDILFQSYSKHSELSYHLLESEVNIIDNALNIFTQDIDIIETKNNKFKLVCFQNHSSYIKFYNIKTNEYISYYDLEEIDRRYIDISIDKWLEK